MNSPIGTAKNRKPSGNSSCRVICQPQQRRHRQHDQRHQRELRGGVATTASSPTSHSRQPAESDGEQPGHGPRRQRGQHGALPPDQPQRDRRHQEGMREGFRALPDADHRRSRCRGTTTSRPTSQHGQGQRGSALQTANCAGAMATMVVVMRLLHVNPGSARRRARASSPRPAAGGARSRSSACTWRWPGCSAARRRACTGGTRSAAACGSKPQFFLKA